MRYKLSLAILSLFLIAGGCGSETVVEEAPPQTGATPSPEAGLPEAVPTQEPIEGRESAVLTDDTIDAEVNSSDLASTTNPLPTVLYSCPGDSPHENTLDVKWISGTKFSNSTEVEMLYTNASGFTNTIISKTFMNDELIRVKFKLEAPAALCPDDTEEAKKIKERIKVDPPRLQVRIAQPTGQDGPHDVSLVEGPTGPGPGSPSPFEDENESP